MEKKFLKKEKIKLGEPRNNAYLAQTGWKYHPPTFPCIINFNLV